MIAGIDWQEQGLLRALERLQEKAVLLMQLSSLMHCAYLLLGQHFQLPSICHLHNAIFTKLMAQLFILMTV